MFGVRKEDVNYWVVCPCCKKKMGFVEWPESDFIECMFCDYEIDLQEAKTKEGA